MFQKLINFVKGKFSVKGLFLVNVSKSAVLCGLFIFIKEILNEELQFLSSVTLLSLQKYRTRI